MKSTTVTTAAAIEATLCREGFTPGLPPSVRTGTAATDKAVCRRVRCPGCGNRGLMYRPWQRGRDYRILAACPACPAAEEL